MRLPTPVMFLRAQASFLLTVLAYCLVAPAASAQTSIGESSGLVWTYDTANFPPDVPDHPWPVNLGTLVPVNVTLSWTARDRDGDPLVFDVYFGTSTPPVLVATSVDTTNYTPGMLDFSTTYYWKIVARDDSGLETAGPIWRFTTRPQNLPPNAPFAPSPGDGSTNRPLNTTLAWQCTDPEGGALTFDVYFGATAPPPLVVSNIAMKSYAPGPLELSTTYYWRIVARDNEGAETSGPQWAFTTRTNAAPYIPYNPSPPNQATNRSVNTDLSWLGGDPDGDAVTYNVHFGTSDPPALVASNLPTTFYDLGKLQLATTYYWRIDAVDVFGASTTGFLWRFTTTPGSPPVLSNPHPMNNSLTVVSPVLSWTATDPDGQQLIHTVFLGTSSPPPFAVTGLTEPIYDPGVLPAAVYYWRVVTFDGITSTVGPVWTFRLALPGDVMMDGVVNLADAQCAMQVFLWNPSCGGPFAYELADVDCDANVTPADARCIHQYAIDGSCTFCGPVSNAPTSVTRTPLVSTEAVFSRGDTLIVRLSVGVMPSLGAFGLYATSDPKLKFLKAQRYGLTQNFDVFETSTPNPGIAVVGAYSLVNVPVAAPAAFIELQFDMSDGPPANLIVGGFVDDLNGAGNVVIPLDEMVSAQPIETELVLHPNRPNPFNPQTTISYSLPARSTDANVRLSIVDASGRLVRTLVNEKQTSGVHEVSWEGKGVNNEAVASGVYFCLLDVGGERRTRKLVLLK
jgi:hypothetical protein